MEEALAGVPGEACVLLEDLTLWISNLLLAGKDDEEILRRGHDAAVLAGSRSGLTIAVGNEVGSGIVPVNASARRFRDLLGEVNRSWAEAAERSALVVAGRILPLQEAGSVPGWTLEGIDADLG